jgi:hypothetical protein
MIISEKISASLEYLGLIRDLPGEKIPFIGQAGACFPHEKHIRIRSPPNSIGVSARQQIAQIPLNSLLLASDISSNPGNIDVTQGKALGISDAGINQNLRSASISDQLIKLAH